MADLTCAYVCPGEGQLIAVEFVPASEKMERPLLVEARDAAAEHLVRFGPCNPHSVLQEKVVVRNTTYVRDPRFFFGGHEVFS